MIVEALARQGSDGNARCMSVEFIPAAHVRNVTARVQAARQRAVDRQGSHRQSTDARYWEALFETNAAEVLGALPSVTLAAGFVVRYRFFGQRGGDLLVPPFVARSSTDVETIRQLLDWHPGPDSIASALVGTPTQNVGLLYSHFSFSQTAV